MIVLTNVSKAVGRGKARKVLFEHLNVTFDMRSHYVLFFERRSGKSTFLGLLSGALEPTSGRVLAKCVVAPVAGSALTFFGLTTRLSRAVKLLARIYAADPEAMCKAVGIFVDDPRLIGSKLADISREIRMKIAYAISYCLPADIYLFEHSPLTGNEEFRQDCLKAFKARTAHSGSILVTSNTRGAEAFGEIGGVFCNGTLTMFPSVKEAAEYFGDIQHENADLVANVDRLVRAGRTDQALALFDEMHPDRPLSSAEFTRLMKILHKQRDYNEMVERCEEQIGKDDLLPDAFFYLTIAAADSGHHEEVVRFADDYAQAGGRDPQIFSAAGKAHEALGQFEAAADSYLRHSANPTGSDLKAAARCLVRAERWDRAKDLLFSDHIEVDVGILERRVQVLFNVGTDQAYEETIVALAEASAHRGLLSAINSRRRLTGHQLVNLFKRLPPNLVARASESERRILVAFLTREGKTAPANDAREIQEFIAGALTDPAQDASPKSEFVESHGEAR